MRAALLLLNQLREKIPNLPNIDLPHTAAHALSLLRETGELETKASESPSLALHEAVKYINVILEEWHENEAFEPIEPGDVDGEVGGEGDGLVASHIGPESEGPTGNDEEPFEIPELAFGVPHHQLQEWSGVNEQALTRMLYELERAGPYMQQMADCLPDMVSSSMKSVPAHHLRGLQTVHQQFTSLVDKLGQLLAVCQVQTLDAVKKNSRAATETIALQASPSKKRKQAIIAPSPEKASRRKQSHSIH